MIRPIAALACAAALLSSCQRSEDRRLQGKPESNAAATADPAFEALGLTEQQLRKADVYGRDKAKLGEVEELHRAPDGRVTGVIVEIEDSDPDRYTLLPLDEVVTMGQGNHIDLRADMTQEAFLALPPVDLPPLLYRANS